MPVEALERVSEPGVELNEFEQLVVHLVNAFVEITSLTDDADTARRLLLVAITTGIAPSEAAVLLSSDSMIARPIGWRSKQLALLANDLKAVISRDAELEQHVAGLVARLRERSGRA